MRVRLLHPSFFSDEKLSRCSYRTRLVFVGLWTCADRVGRLLDNEKQISGNVLPFERRGCARALTELERLGFIARYATAAGPVIQIVNFLKYQQPHPKEKAGPYPDPASGLASGSASGSATGSASGSATGFSGKSQRPGQLPSQLPGPSVSISISNSDPVTTDAPSALSDRKQTDPRVSGNERQRRRVAAVARASHGASAPVVRGNGKTTDDHPLVTKYFGKLGKGAKA